MFKENVSSWDIKIYCYWKVKNKNVLDCEILYIRRRERTRERKEKLAGYYANQNTAQSLCKGEKKISQWTTLRLKLFEWFFSEWRKAELMRARSNPAQETKMLRGNKSPAGIPAIHRLTIKTLIKYDPSEVQVL